MDQLVMVRDTRFEIGGNNPPDNITAAHDTMVALSDWMQENPVIDNEDTAREAKKMLDRAKSCAGEIEDERDRQVRPLNEQITAINARYKVVHNTNAKNPGILDKVMNELKARLTRFIAAEEAKRIRAAEEKRVAAEEAERIAREAEVKEREAIENAKAGELCVDVTQVVVEADSRFADFERANREADRADRDTHVRVGGGWKRSISLRNKETLRLDNYNKAISVIGPHPKIEEAILSAAREWRNKHGSLPSGVSALIERQI